MGRLATIGKILGIFVATVLVLVASLSCAIFGCAWAVHQWSLPGGWWLVVFSVVIFVPLVGLYAFGLRRLLQNHWRFSMRGVIIATAIAAFLSASIGHISRNQIYRQSVIFRLRTSGGKIEANARRSRNFLHHVFGFDPFEEVSTVWVTEKDALAVFVENPKVFRNVRRIIIEGNFDWHQHVGRLNELPTLTSAVVSVPFFERDDVEALVAWDNLETVRIFGGTGIADDDMQSFSKLKHLTELQFCKVDVSDEGLSSLAELSNLKRLVVVFNTKVTPAGLGRIQTSLPNCEVVSDAFPK